MSEKKQLSASGVLNDVNTVGWCVVGQVQGGIAIAGDGCTVWDGDGLAVIGFVGAGSGTEYFALSSGPFLSNASEKEDLLGRAGCLGGGGGVGLAPGVEFCIGQTESGEPTNFWSIWGGIAVTPGPADVHAIFGQVRELFYLDIPCVGGWKLPSGHFGPIEWEGPTLPSVGCG